MVGAVFFIIAATTVISYISYSMNSIDQFSQSVIVAEAENINRGMEKISITQITIDGGEFNMTVANTGSLPVHLTRLWVTDEDMGTDKKANIDVRINPGKEKYNIGQGTGISADSTTNYFLKAVTERGNLATYQVSTDVSTRISLLAPGSSILSETIGITLLITNNSTLPNNIIDLNPTLSSNVTLTQVGTNQSSVEILKQGATAIHTWRYIAPNSAMGISFNGSYTGAPSGSFSVSNTTIYNIDEAQSATSSQWSAKATKVGILISGVPSPIDSTGDDGLSRWGVGIINPLNRDVEIYAVAINTISAEVFTQDVLAENMIEPTSGWDKLSKGSHSVVFWNMAGNSPIVIPSESVGQFRVTINVQGASFDYLETPVMIQALTSEGKMSITYNISLKTSYPTINVFYTTDPSDPVGASDENWGYKIEGIESGSWHIFNATVQNSSSNDKLDPPSAAVAMTILIPADFTYNVQCDPCTYNSDWNLDDPLINPDGSTFLRATTKKSPAVLSNSTFQFNATAPIVSSDSLYVFQTTTYYPKWIHPLISASLSEAGVEVIPSP